MSDARAGCVRRAELWDENDRSQDASSLCARVHMQSNAAGPVTRVQRMRRWWADEGGNVVFLWCVVGVVAGKPHSTWMESWIANRRRVGGGSGVVGQSLLLFLHGGAAWPP